MNVGFEIFGFLHVFERRVYVWAVFGECLHKLFGPDKRQSLELDESELLTQQRRAGTHFHRIRLQMTKNSNYLLLLCTFIVNDRNWKLDIFKKPPFEVIKYFSKCKIRILHRSTKSCLIIDVNMY